ncbi:MAG: hypothetical protein ACTSP3_00465 [Candidatus Heimdallarchaeaceae archaeon]
MSWKSILKQILREFGGKAYLAEIYKKVEELSLKNEFLAKSIKTNYKSSIRCTLQVNPRDFFQKEKGSGLWYLREENEVLEKNNLLLTLLKISLDIKSLQEFSIEGKSKVEKWKLIKVFDDISKDYKLKLEYNYKSVSFQISSKKEYEDLVEIKKESKNTFIINILSIIEIISKLSLEERKFLLKQLSSKNRYKEEDQKEKVIRKTKVRPIKEKKVLIKLTPSKKRNAIPAWKAYNRIPVRSKIRLFFPSYKEKFILETDIGDIETYVTARGSKKEQELQTAGQWIIHGLRPWFKYHSDLKSGDTLIITEKIPKRRYSLEIKRKKTRKKTFVISKDEELSRELQNKELDIKPKKNQIAIKLTQGREGREPRWRKYYLIPFRRKNRLFFPEYGKEFILKTDIGDIRTHVTSITKDQSIFDKKTAGTYIRKGMANWFRSHPELTPGDTLIITEIKNKEIYKLEIEKSSINKEKETFDYLEDFVEL